MSSLGAAWLPVLTKEPDMEVCALHPRPLGKAALLDFLYPPNSSAVAYCISKELVTPENCTHYKTQVEGARTQKNHLLITCMHACLYVCMYVCTE